MASRKFRGPIRTEYKQRAFDGKWELLGLFMDVENSYTYGSEQGIPYTITPEKWVTMKVYDYEIEFVG
tara:strand:- start:21260 stop:21463 length:204 start_codon:yes stop_codon:yes gene_type:complete